MECDFVELGTAPKTVTEEMTPDEDTQKLLKEVVSRLGLEPRALALKAPSLLRKINAMTLQNRPMSDSHLQRVTVCVSYIGQETELRFTNFGGATSDNLTPQETTTQGAAARAALVDPCPRCRIQLPVILHVLVHGFFHHESATRWACHGVLYVRLGGRTDVVAVHIKTPPRR